MKKAICLFVVVLFSASSPAFAGWGSGGRHDVQEHIDWRGGKMPWYGALARDLAPAFGDVVRSNANTGQTVITQPLPGGGAYSARYDRPMAPPTSYRQGGYTPPPSHQYDYRPRDRYYTQRRNASPRRVSDSGLHRLRLQAIQDHTSCSGMSYQKFDDMSQRSREAYGRAWDQQELALSKCHRYYRRSWR